MADPADVVATLTAFANDLQNLGGGYVVCGAREDRGPDGFPLLIRSGLSSAQLREIEGTVLTRCRERISPSIAPRVEELPSDDPERRILVFVQPATERAHTFRRRSEGGKHFVRVGRSTIEARNGLLLDLLVRKGDLEPWDRRPCPGATVGDLDLLVLREALQRMGLYSEERGVEPYLQADRQLSPFVPPLCVAEPLTGALRPRNYAVLLFGREPQRFIPGAVSIYSAYPGLDRAEPVAKRTEIAGTLLEQADRLQGLLDAEAITLFDKTDREQPNVQKYPTRALQEAMVNALAHRDYALADPTRLTSFVDRIEFLSPGPLPQGVDLQELLRGTVPPTWRNQSLAWFLNRLQLAQAEGQGVITIRRTMKALGCPPPLFKATEAWVRCTLRAHPRARRLETKSRSDRSVRSR